MSNKKESEVDTDFKDDVFIDRHSLDEEWLNQASLFYKWSERYAQAMFKRDKAKDQMELERAKADSAIRRDPLEYGIEKVTEASLAAAVLQDKGYLDKKDAYLQANLDCNILMGAKTAMEHKKTALEVLSKLYLSGYWSEVKVPEASKKKYEDEGTEKSLSENPRIRRRQK